MKKNKKFALFTRSWVKLLFLLLISTSSVFSFYTVNKYNKKNNVKQDIVKEQKKVADRQIKNEENISLIQDEIPITQNYKCLGLDRKVFYTTEKDCQEFKDFWTRELGEFPTDPNEIIQCLGVDGRYSTVSRITCEDVKKFWDTHPSTVYSNLNSSSPNNSDGENSSEQTFTIISSAGNGGIINPNGNTSINSQSNKTYYILADDGYMISNVVVDGTSEGEIDYYEFQNVNANHTITVSFEEIPISVVTINNISPASGYDTKSVNISITGSGFLSGTSVTLTKSGQSSISCTDVVVASNTTISNAKCDITTKELGEWNVIVTNSDTGSGISTNGFTVREYQLGDMSPSGGYIFYKNSNSSTDGWKYMEAAPVNQVVAKAWADNNDYDVVGTLKTIGSGSSNSFLISQLSEGTSGTAIEYAWNYSLNGFTDWFLPSVDELKEMHTVLHKHEPPIGNFTTNTAYWSSSQASATTAWRFNFDILGTGSTRAKSQYYLTRSARQFLVCPTYQVYYQGNENTGGSAPVDLTQYFPGSSVTLSNGGTLTKTDYSFQGWNTKADGSGTDYGVGTTLAMLANDVTLYAKWYRPNFTIAILPDTQSYVRWNDDAMTNQLDWLVANKNKLNLKFVSQVGDIVQNWDSSASEWSFVQTEMAKIKNAGIPFSLLPGNHDYSYMTRNSTMFNTYFPRSNYSNMTSFGGTYDENSDNQYHILTIDKDNDGTNDDKLLIISLEFGPREAVVNWAKNILTIGSSIPAIIITHAFLKPDGNLLEHGDNHAASNGYGLGSDVYDGDELWESLVKPHNNVRFVFCGHDGNSTDGSALRTSTHNGIGGDGSSVYQIMTNYQYYPVNEAGYLVLLNFTSSSVSMKTYSPWLSTYKTDIESQSPAGDWGWIPWIN